MKTVSDHWIPSLPRIHVLTKSPVSTAITSTQLHYYYYFFFFLPTGTSFPGQGVKYSIEASSSINTGMETTHSHLMPNYIIYLQVRHILFDSCCYCVVFLYSDLINSCMSFVNSFYIYVLCSVYIIA